MSLAPLSSPSVPATSDPSSELRAAKMAKQQQQMEGAAALSLMESAGSLAAPPPTGSAGSNINVMV